MKKFLKWLLGSVPENKALAEAYEIHGDGAHSKRIPQKYPIEKFSKKLS